MRERGAFDRLLAQAGFEAEAPPKEAAPRPKAEPLRERDALSLSVQAAKALKPGGGKKRPDEAAKPGAESSDWQGNRARLSFEGQRLAEGARAAWETRLKQDR